ncbi:uncharacterized protein K452DRAFT_236177 [Aplosporella prunicola CBS 121167]|uniref:FAD-binding domain-containing protein n=1 Tax=Aplosporella prunicola CBS 121167 TaxID=1176127 RepID=A0A6A6B0V1_9PEZI|nr:uncharacterized protein K452DRAFT_236177 [Aplosporella prunicola CBS 121167]KAF2137188.1 hypothetical protein K452DRAFT_236177 [Aplosporella prunicola CBS 121167]
MANILEQQGIAYVLWESQSQVAPPAGASIGLMPNGLRILDQIGVIQDLEQYAVPHDAWEHRDGNGTLYCTLRFMRSYPDQAVARLGYSGFFMERQRLLEILYAKVGDKTKVHTSKRLSSVQNFSTHAIITATDGSQVSCDFVVGADGVRSAVRREIEALTPGLQETLDSTYFASKYACVYGISNALPQITPGRFFTVYQSDASLLIFSGMNGVLYWFLIEDLKTSVEFSENKRYAAKDIEAAYAKVANTTVTTGVKFSDIFANRRTAIMTGLEEGIAKNWVRGRMVLMGDAAHKMVPHAAMGANQAMESAACFVNHLLDLRGQHGDSIPRNIPTSDIEKCLKSYVQKRCARVTNITQSANFSCRSQLKIGPEAEAFILGLPNMKDEAFLSKILLILSEAEKLENWKNNSGRVGFYSQQAEKIRQQKQDV